MNKWIAGAAATLAIAAGSGMWMLDAAAAVKLEALKIGEAFPDFKLTDTTGKEHTPSQYEGKIVVFNFCTQECPFSRGADPSINALASAYAEKGIVFLGVDSNKNLEPAAIQAYMDETKIPYPILKDTGNVLADAVGARVTPEIYIMDQEGKLVYHGAPDNRSGPTNEPTEHYLKDALEALTSGKAIERTTVKAWGCGIKRAG